MLFRDAGGASRVSPPSGCVVLCCVVLCRGVPATLITNLTMVNFFNFIYLFIYLFIYFFLSNQCIVSILFCGSVGLFILYIHVLYDFIVLLFIFLFTCYDLSKLFILLSSYII